MIRWFVSYAAHGGREPLVQLDEFGGVAVLVLVRQRFVQQVVARDDCLVAVALRDGLPQLHGQVGVDRVGEEFGKSVRRIVDVRSGLAARRAVQIEHDQQAVRAAPADEAVDEPESLFEQRARLALHDAGVDRDPHVIEAFGGNRDDVVLGDELVAEPGPELVGSFGPDESVHEALDLPRG